MVEERREVGVGPVETLVVHGHGVGDVLGRGAKLTVADRVNGVEVEGEVTREPPVEVAARVGVEERVVRVGRIDEGEELPLAVLLDEPQDLRQLLRE